MMSTGIEISKLRNLFKYVSDSPSVVDGIFIDHKIRFTQPAALNDPLEFNPAIRFDSDDDNYRRYTYRGIDMPSIHDWYWLNLIESRINKHGILSLTDNPLSFEMWCHYANGHKGLLVEFNVTDKSKPELRLSDGTSLRAHKVRYVKDYSVNIDRLHRGGTTIPFHRIRDAIFLRKTKHWKHEREFRIVRQLSECDAYQPPKQRTSYRDNHIYLFPISLNCISSVVFGVNTSRDVKLRVIDACKDSDITFLQTVVQKDQQNRMDFVPIDSFGSIDRYLGMLPQLFTTDSILAKYRDRIPVDSLHEIPYYHLQPKDYEEYYRKQLARQIVGE